MDMKEIFDDVEAGRRLGHDLHRFSRQPAQADWHGSVREGFEEARARGGPRKPGDRFHRKWLQLRMGAWQRGRTIAADVTPDLLRRLDVDRCPVTREALTHGLRTGSDWSIDRLNNDGGYVGGNLAVMSARANRAKGGLAFAEVLAAATGERPRPELDAAQWLRLAVLMEGPTFATRQHLAPLLPLVAPLPCTSVRLAMQQVQRLFTLQCASSAGRNTLVRSFQWASPSEQSRFRLEGLADGVYRGLRQLEAGEECWDVWLQPATMAALDAWRTSLDTQAWANAARIAGLLAGGKRVGPGMLQSWHLETRGYVPA